ncbi:prephenate dehydratase [candidate division WS5 bacterium]|uniref:Prephenate dehydratase n=1 Tax=candidate division WS5 bacterium TaxID=2093353 RepID=A0A419DA02_9BACT|nr:MAG: prephenate dehydratase [candidate division WS5 bacterium]
MLQQKTKEKIAVLGPEGTFSHQAAMNLNGNSEIRFYKTIHDVFDAVDREECHKGVVPIENSLGGSVGFTLDALLEYGLNIEQEEVVPIVHCLMAKKGTKKGDIQYICSHSQSYSQCEKYIRKNFPHADIIDTPSNGESARLVSSCHSRTESKSSINSGGNPEYAAIGPELAAEIYNLEILQKSIQDSKHNVTKFVVISKNKTQPSGCDRTSITVYPQVDKPGLLWEILGYFKENNVNLSKIESRPSKGKLGDYVFYIDFHGHASEKDPKKIIEQLEKVAQVKILGSYERKY